MIVEGEMIKKQSWQLGGQDNWPLLCQKMAKKYSHKWQIIAANPHKSWNQEKFCIIVSTKNARNAKKIINQNIKGSIYGHKKDSLCQKSHLKPTHLTLNGPNW